MMNNVAQDRLEKARNRYDTAKLILASFTAIAVIVLLGLVLLGQQRAQDARDEIKDCIDSTGECAQANGARGVDLISASIVCSQRNISTKAEAVACVKEVLVP